MLDKKEMTGTVSPVRSLEPETASTEPKHDDASGSSAAERRLRTKIDLNLMPMIMLLYLMNFIDRTNIGE
jgi:hypothetical protein